MVGIDDDGLGDEVIASLALRAAVKWARYFICSNGDDEAGVTRRKRMAVGVVGEAMANTGAGCCAGTGASCTAVTTSMGDGAGTTGADTSPFRTAICEEMGLLTVMVSTNERNARVISRWSTKRNRLFGSPPCMSCFSFFIATK